MLENKKEFKLISKKNPKSLLPNTLTIFGVCLGLSSIKFALDSNYAMAIIAIGFAAILDTLDGRVARLIKGSSKVGKELDSLTDVISFGVAPGFIMYFWVLNEIRGVETHYALFAGVHRVEVFSVRHMLEGMLAGAVIGGNLIGLGFYIYRGLIYREF